MTWVFRTRSAWVFGENVIGGPQITTATGTFAPGDTVTINGTGLDAVTSVLLGGETQTIATQSATQITFTAVRGGLKYGAHALDIDDGSGGTDRVFVSLTTQSGWGYVNVAGLPWPSGQYSVLQDASPAAENGDQIRFQTVTDQGGTVTMNSDGTFEIDTTGFHSFDVEAWDATDSSWPPGLTTITVNELGEIAISGSIEGTGVGEVDGVIAVDGALPTIDISGAIEGTVGGLSGSIEAAGWTSLQQVRLVAEYEVVWSSEA